MQEETRRQLGRSELKISTVTMGCWAIAGDATWGPQKEEDAIDAILTALDCGVNCFDSAEMYGNGYSEQILAKALAGRRGQAIICSKVSPAHAGTWEQLSNACERSLQNLKTDYIDLFYLHWPNRSVPIAQIIEWFGRLKKAGKIRCFGVSNFGLKDLSGMLAVGRCEVNQLPYNLLWRVIEHEVLPLCCKNDVSVACYSPMAQGLLTGKFPDAASVPASRARTRHFSAAHPQIRHQEQGQEEETFAAIKRIRTIAAELDCPMAELSLAWLLHQPGVATVIAGARNPAQMSANAKAMQRKLTPDILVRLDQATATLKARFDTNPDMWQSGSNTRYQ